MSTNIVNQQEIKKAIDRMNKCNRLLMEAGITEKDKQQVIDNKEFRSELAMFWKLHSEIWSNARVFNVKNPISIIDVYEKFGSYRPWSLEHKSKPGLTFRMDNWEEEEFAQDKSSSGDYVIELKPRLRGRPLSFQEESLPSRWVFPHPAVIAFVLLSHFEETGEMLLEGWTIRTSLPYSDDSHIAVTGEYTGGQVVISSIPDDNDWQRVCTVLSWREYNNSFKEKYLL